MGRIGSFVKSNAIGLVALFFALGGVAVAQEGASVTSADIVDGAVKSVDIRNAAVGPADMAPSIRPRWARVEAGTTPSLERDRGVASVRDAGLGMYDVTFDGNITACGWTATFVHNTASAVPPTGEIAVSRIGQKVLRVHTRNSSGAPVDLPTGSGFTIAAHC